MAAVSSAPAGTMALTSPSGNHGDAMWDFPSGASENSIPDNNGPPRRGRAMPTPLGAPNGDSPSSSSYGKTNHHVDVIAGKIRSPDNVDSVPHGHGQLGDGSTGLAPALAIEPRPGPASPSDWTVHPRQHPPDERRRQVQQTPGLEYSEEDSKWIHRDKLAKIESEELQAAGIVIPRVRASSKQRRVRGQLSMDSVRSRNRSDSVTGDQGNEEPTTSAWDLRTPEEIAEEERNAYFAAHNVKGASRIPVARISPAPIPQDFLERGSSSVGRVDSSEGDTTTYPKTRSRSASTSTKELEAVSAGNRVPAAKRAVADTSPNKARPRQTSAASKTSMTTGRPKTRSGPGKDAGRPVTRSGEQFAASYQPEGDPPWVLDSYKPDPRLPPDQQLLPTVAKRLRQERWEKEGKFGDVYDKDFRPLNHHQFPQAQERGEEGGHDEEDEQAQTREWPLRPGAAKSPKQSSYSTMPKIADRPPASPMSPTPPMTSPKSPFYPPAPLPAPSLPHAPEAATRAEPQVETRQGCGCCLVM